MSYLIILMTISCLCTGITYGMDCQKNIFEKFINGCPGIWNDSSKSYCCYDFANDNYFCCTKEEFIMKMGGGIGVLLTVAIIGAIVISLMICCILCLCCSCCPWYRRRHRGTVYGKVQTPSVVQVVQPSTNPPPSNHANQTPQNIYTPYPPTTTVAGMPQPPPAYTIEPYARQAPYNPGYVQ